MRARPPRSSSIERRLEAAVHRSLSGRRVVLAVSGGRDSMALLGAVARVVPGSVAVVATFDHGTGAAASRAARLVAEQAAALGFTVVVGHAASRGRTEAEWRSARRAFLHEVARATDAAIVTAHTRDDQVETVLMRVMRDAGARGLAALYATSDVLRPLIGFTRAEVTEYAGRRRLRWMDDPANESLAFLRNRVRRDMLPALVRARPSSPDALLRIAEKAARWRRRVDAWAARVGELSGGRIEIPAAVFADRSPGQLAVMWQALGARVGLAMDWRGTERVVAFTIRSRTGARVPLAGRWQVARSRDAFELSRATEFARPPMRALQSGTRWLGWRFVDESTATMAADAVSDEWVALLPEEATLSVRTWQAGDRMRLAPGVERKVKRFLSDAHVNGARRGVWPVVLAGDEIVWIPGVRRSDAASVRPGRPGVLFRCVPDYL